LVDTNHHHTLAARVGVPTIGLLSGGFGEDELRAAGCRSVYADAADLVANLEDALFPARAAGVVALPEKGCDQLGVEHETSYAHAVVGLILRQQEETDWI
ncbi:MAG: hypothetical protein ABJB93_00615, partial [Gaiellales bacterium]